MTNYRKLVDDAKKQIGVAKAANRRHSADLTRMKRVAEDARESLRDSQARQRNRATTVLTGPA